MNFLRPKLRTRPWQPEKGAVMSVPKTAMYQNNRTPPGKYNVWFAREVTPIYAEPEALSVKQTSDHLFRLRVAAADPGHHTATRCAIYNINHNQRRNILS
jgi:hypothetical protein